MKTYVKTNLGSHNYLICYESENKDSLSIYSSDVISIKLILKEDYQLYDKYIKIDYLFIESFIVDFNIDVMIYYCNVSKKFNLIIKHQNNVSKYDYNCINDQNSKFTPSEI